MMAAKALMAGLLLAAVSCTVAAYRVHHDAARWEPDAAIYLRMALQDRGESYAAARADANRFMRTTSDATNPGSRGFYDDVAPAYYEGQFTLFRGRPLYPWLGAMLYGRFGPHGLQVVSGASYALAVPVLYWLLLDVAPWWIAAIGALAFAAARPIVDMASYAMTDELTLLCWIVALGAMIAYLRLPRASMLALLAAASLALAFTRPAVYLPLGAALGALVAARGPARAAALRLTAVTGTVAIVYAAYTLIAHAAGLGEVLRWIYGWQRAIGATSSGFARWYTVAEMRAFAETLGVVVYHDGAVFLLALAALGAVALRRTPQLGLLVGALVAAPIAIVPDPMDVVRTVELPWLPVLVVLATAGLARVAPRTGAA